MIHHDPNKPKATYPEAVSIRGNVISGRPLVVETYSRYGLMGKRYYWRVRHKSNGETMASGQPYWRAEDRNDAVDTLFPDLGIDALG